METKLINEHYQRLISKRIGKQTITEFSTKISNLACHFIDCQPNFKEILGLGLGFIPCSKPFSVTELKNQFQEFRRKMILRLFFSKKESDNSNSSSSSTSSIYDGRPKHKSNWLPDLKFIPPDFINTLDNCENSLLLSYSDKLLNQQYKNNLSFDKRILISQLRSSTHFTVKPSDKNLGPCLISNAWYEQQIQSHLSDTKTYKRIENKNGQMDRIITKCDFEIKQKLVPICFDIRDKPFLNPTKDQLKLPKFYLLPKVHKDPIKTRPIVAAVNCVLTNTSTLINYYLNPIVSTYDYILRDSLNLIRLLENSIFLKDIIFVTGDVESLYTNINNEQGLKALNSALNTYCFRKYQNHEHRDRISKYFISFVMTATQFVLDNNYFTIEKLVNGIKETSLYLQINGTAMGTNLAPAYANIFLAIKEKAWMKRYQSKIFLYRRLLDDILVIFKSDTNIPQAMKELREAIGINITYTQDIQGCNFLDLTIYKGDRFETNGKVDIQLYSKTMNKYLYLPFNSFHTRSQKEAFIIGELIRYVRACSDLSKFHEHCLLFYQRLRDRGFPHSFIYNIFSRIDYNNRQTLLIPKNREERSPNAMPIVFTSLNNPILQPSFIREHLNLSITSLEKLVEEPIRLVIGLKKPSNLRTLLVRK